MLDVLANRRTTESYAAIEKLLKQGLPAKGDPGVFVTSMADSLQLTKKLYPYLITLSGDSLLGAQLFYLHEDMIDSSHINISAFKPYQHLMMKAASYELKKIVADKEPIYYSSGVYSLLRTLKTLNTDSAKLILRKFTAVKQSNIKLQAAALLLKMKEAVDPLILHSIAADKSFRISLYNELKEMKQEKLFPAKYFNQRAFAEGYIYNSLDEEEEPAKLQFIGERTAEFKGKKQKFYLYKAIYDNDGEQTAYLCIGGAFGVKVPAQEDVSGIYWDEEFSQSQIDKQLKAYLALYEEEEEE
jgi:hypothetical protein